MSLSFKFVPLTFQKNQDEIKRQIRNTVILSHFFARNDQTIPLGNLIEGTQYGFNASALQSGKNKFLRISDITDGKVEWETVPFCDCQDEETYLLFKDDILIARTGGTTGKSFKIESAPEGAIYAGYLIRIRANKKTLPDFLDVFLNSYSYWSQIVSLNEGEFRPSVNANKLKELLLPVCSPNEQTDIVQLAKGMKVIGYEGLISRIEKTIKEFDSSIEVISLVESEKEVVSQLKQSILQEAIQGKLTAEWRAQRQADGIETESASELLKRIQVEKARLINPSTPLRAGEKKIKKEKPLPPITEEEMPFELPEGWEWCRLGQILLFSDSGKSPNCEKRPAKFNEWGVLTTTSIQAGIFQEEANKVLPLKFKVDFSQKVEQNDVLITRAGPLNRTGVACKVKSINKQLILSDKTIRLKYPPELINPDFLVSGLNSRIIRALLIQEMTGMAESQVNISQPNIKKIPFPVSPFEEQNAIVEKVESLMEKCRTLEEEISQSEQHAKMLMQAVLKEAFEN